MTSQGSPHGRFQRTLERGDVLEALGAAHQLGRLTLADALGLTVLLAERDPARYERAAVRWLGRWLLEVGGVELEEAQLVAAAFAALPGTHAETAKEVLTRTADRHGLVIRLRSAAAS